MDISTIFSYTLHDDDTRGDYLVTPAVAYFCFDSIDFDFEKPVLEEDIFSDVKKEQKALKKKRTSELTGTVYKLSPEQRRALKYLKKKYGKSLTNEIKEYRKKTLAPYQVAKAYTEKTKAIYPKDVLGMSKEEYLRYKKSAEEKIANMRSNKYEELTKEVMDINSKQSSLNNMEDFFGTHDISDTALNKLFKKYGFYSTRYTEAEMRKYQRKMSDVDSIRKQLISKIVKGEETEEVKKKLEDAVNDLGKTKKSLQRKEVTSKEVGDLRKLTKKIDAINDYNSRNNDDKNELDNLKELSKKLDGIDNVSQETRNELQNVIDIDGANVTQKSFEKEYDNFLMREKIRSDIRKGVDNKYVDDYKHMLDDVKDSLNEKRTNIISKMAKERESKTLNEKEKKIYELKLGAKKDSDRLSDYTLKIKEEDFFDPKYYNKSEELKNAEKKIDAEIKRFERSLESKMDEKDFQLLRKYRLISNLVTIKGAKQSELYGQDKKKSSSEDN